LGRFCIDQRCRDPDVLRLAWATLTGYVDRTGAALLFGCASFAGTDPALYAAAFAYLRENAMLREGLVPGRKAHEVHFFTTEVDSALDKRLALKQMPPLLRSYLALGGGVSDHAVVDRAMNTLHVFIAVETALIPPKRQKLLRALCGTAS
jgi:putative hemolysin